MNRILTYIYMKMCNKRQENQRQQKNSIKEQEAKGSNEKRVMNKKAKQEIKAQLKTTDLPLRGKSQDSTDSSKEFRDQCQQRTSSEFVSVNTSHMLLAYFMFPFILI